MALGVAGASNGFGRTLVHIIRTYMKTQSRETRLETQLGTSLDTRLDPLDSLDFNDFSSLYGQMATLLAC